MGRYDGEDYEDRGSCNPGCHQIERNGCCRLCHRGPFDGPDHKCVRSRHLDQCARCGTWMPPVAASPVVAREEGQR